MRQSQNLKSGHLNCLTQNLVPPVLLQEHINKKEVLSKYGVCTCVVEGWLKLTRSSAAESSPSSSKSYRCWKNYSLSSEIKSVVYISSSISFKGTLHFNINHGQNGLRSSLNPPKKRVCIKHSEFKSVQTKNPKTFSAETTQKSYFRLYN